MIHTLQNLALAQAADLSDATRETWRLLEMPAAWVVVLVLLPGLAVVAGLGYWRENLTTPQRIALSGLRFASMLALLVVLFRPVTVQHQESVKPAEVVVLLDDSASMRRKDSYAGDDETRTRLTASAGKPPEQTTRLEQIGEALPKGLTDGLGQRAYDVRSFRFAEELAPLADLEDLRGRGHSTNLGDALERALADRHLIPNAKQRLSLHRYRRIIGRVGHRALIPRESPRRTSRVETPFSSTYRRACRK